MIPYYLLVIYVLLIVILYKSKIIEHDNVKFLLIMIPLFMFAILRGNGKGDYFAYIDRGEKIKEVADIFDSMKTGMEPGYGFVAYLVYHLGLPRQFVIVLMNAVSMWLMSKYIKNCSVNWGLSVLLYLPLYFQFDMHAVRTGVSIAICAYAYRYIKERSLIKYVICVLIASLFHSIAIISLAAYFLYELKIKMETGLLVLFIELALIRLLNINYYVGYLLKLLRLEYLGNKLISYTVDKVDLYGYPMPLYDPRIWIGIGVFFLASNYIHDKTKEKQFFINGTFMYAFIMILLSNTTFFAYRVSAFYYIYLVVTVPMLISEYQKWNQVMGRYRRLQMYLLCTFFFSALNMAYARITMVDYISVFRSGAGLVPYR